MTENPGQSTLQAAPYGGTASIGGDSSAGSFPGQPPPLPFVVAREPIPTGGLDLLLYQVTGGRWNRGPSKAQRERAELLRSVARPLRGTRRIAVLSLKGGVGKTTTTVGLGSALAIHRGDRVIAVDGNPDAGTLAERMLASNPATIRDLIEKASTIRSYPDMQAFTSQADSRLEVVAGDQDPDISDELSDAEYRTVQETLGLHYNIIVTDCGTGLRHSAMTGILATSDDLIVVVGASVDAARRAGRTLDWLAHHDYSELAANAIAVISPVRAATDGSRTREVLDRAALLEYFAGRCRAVVEIPADPHLGLGAEIRWEEMHPDTQLAYVRLASAVTDQF